MLDMGDILWPRKHSHLGGLWQRALCRGAGSLWETPLKSKEREGGLRRAEQEQGRGETSWAGPHHRRKARINEAAVSWTLKAVFSGFSPRQETCPVRWMNMGYFRFNGGHFKDLLTCSFYLFHQRLFCTQDTMTDTGVMKGMHETISISRELATSPRGPDHPRDVHKLICWVMELRGKMVNAAYTM